MRERGILICLEGNDAAGKATQTGRLAEKISRAGREAVVYSFPRYKTALGETILRHLRSETLVAALGAPINEPLALPDYMAPRIHVRAPEDPLWFQCVCLADKYEAAAEIEAHIAGGRTVICDRWKPSAIAFGAADGLDVNWIERAQERLRTADVNLFLSVSEEESLRRRPNLRDRYEKDRDKQKIVRLNYARIWDDRATDLTEPNVWAVIDGEGTIDEVSSRIWQQVMDAGRAVRT